MSYSSPLKNLSEIQISLFGRFRIERGAAPIQLSTRKTELLLAYLILNPGRHAREKVAALFWGDSSEREARNSLRNALNVLKKSLGHEFLIADRQSLEINPEYPIWVDALDFEKQISEFLSNPGSGTSEAVFDLYQDELLFNFYDDWIIPLREHYRNLLLNSLLKKTQQMRSSSEYEQAIEYAHKALAFDGTLERAHQHLMFCYMARGDRSAALKQYEACQRVLREELAVEPSAATVALYEWIRETPAENKPFEAQITNLPISLTSFIGRKREMAEVKLLLASTRLLTLTGPGGSGKTRLVIQVATDLLDSYKDGVWWVDLGALIDESLIPQTIAKAFGIPEIATQSMRDTLTSHLRSKHLLLVMDNCEHLIEAASQISVHLLETCPDLKIMTTSRESLNITGETVWQVPTLSLPDPQHLLPTDKLLEYEAVRLFVERASALRNDFKLTVENAPFVAQICRQLDGIPLAIELAAARIKVLTPEQIAARLGDRFRLLTDGSRIDLPRHKTLQAAIDWSFDLLDEQERILFRRLGVFSGGFSLEAAEAVCPNENIKETEFLDLLTNLVDKSLVIKEGEPGGEARFRMLETIRQYSYKSLLDSKEEIGIRKRHFEYFRELAELPNPHLGFFLPDHEILSWLRQLELEKDNLRTALNFSLTDTTLLEGGISMAGKLHWFWLVVGQFSEGREWLDRLLVKSQDVPASIQAQAWLSAGFLCCWQGDFASARARLTQSFKLYKAIHENPGIAFSLHGLGFAANGLGEYELAGSIFKKGLKIAREINDKWLVSFALHFTAIGTSFQGNYELATAQFNEHIQLSQDGSGNIQGIAFSHFHLGRIARLQGNYALSHTHHAEGVRIFWKLGDRRGIGYSLSGFACLALAREELKHAARLFGAVDLIREKLGSLLEVILQREYEQAKHTAQELLSEDEFFSEWSNGRSMSLEKVIQYVLAQEGNNS